MTNPLGVISMAYARPFGPEHFPVFERIRRAGLDFIELLVPEPGELDLAETRKALAASGLDVVLAARIHAGRDPASDDEAVRSAALDYLAYTIETAAALGARIVGGPIAGGPLVFAGRAPSPVDEALRAERERRVVETLQKAGSRAAAAGVTLAVEPLNRFESDILNTTRQGIELLDKVGEDHVGLMLDSFHMNMEEKSIPGALRAAGRRLVHFQANENDRGFVGTGHIDWPAVADALAEIGYQGPITLEPFRRDDERIAVPLAQWRPPARDEDADLAASATYLRTLLGPVR